MIAQHPVGLESTILQKVNFIKDLDTEHKYTDIYGDTHTASMRLLILQLPYPLAAAG